LYGDDGRLARDDAPAANVEVYLVFLRV